MLRLYWQLAYRWANILLSLRRGKGKLHLAGGCRFHDLYQELSGKTGRFMPASGGGERAVGTP